MKLIQGDKIVHEGKEKVVTDVHPFEGDDTLDRVTMRPIDDPDGEFTFTHPDDCQIIGHLQPDELPGWVEHGRNDWQQVTT
jgi:hypothetical protein